MDEILINTSTAGDQSQSAVAGLRDTRFVVVWADVGSGDIRGQMFGLNGSRSGGEFVVNLPGAAGTRRQLPAIVECGLGFAVAWTEQAPGSPAQAPAQVKLRTFDQQGLAGPESQVSTAVVDRTVGPAMARLSNGGFVIVWADKRDQERIRVQRFGFDGAKSGPEFRANTIAGLHREIKVACLPNGNIVVAWRARLPGPLLVHLQVFDSNGPVGGEQTTNLDVTEIAMTALDSGQFVIAHVRSALDGEPGFETTIAQLAVFEASGAPTNIRFTATNEQRIQSSWPTLVPLPGVRFLLAWTQVNVDNVPAGIDIKGRVFSLAQGPGQVIQFNTSAGGTRFSLSAATISGPDGEIAFAAWSDERETAGDTTGRAVRGRPLVVAPRLVPAYVTNAFSGTVSVVETGGNTVVASVTVGGIPRGIAVAPDGKQVYVANEGLGMLSVIDTAANTVASVVPVGLRPFGVAVSPDGRHAYVTNDGAGTISVVDTASRTVVATIAVGSGPIAVAARRDGRRVYVANKDSNSVSVIDAVTNAVVSTVAVESFPQGVAVTPDGKHAYVTNTFSSTVSVIDTAADRVATTIAVGNGPSGVAIAPNGKRAYVANAGSNAVSVIDTTTNTVASTVIVGSGAQGIAVTPDGAHAYVTNPGANTVSVIDTANNTVTKTIQLGGQPTAIGIKPPS